MNLQDLYNNMGASSRMKQKTILKPVQVTGQGLHSGEEVRVTFKPADINSGITFIRTDLVGSPKVPAKIEYHLHRLRRSALKKGEAEIHTVEHCLSAIHALGIDNLDIEIDGIELPGLDGSAQPYFQALKEAGVTEQDEEREFLTLSKPVSVSEKEASLVALPKESGLTISYTLDYNTPYLKAQHYTFHLTEENYEKEIAGARTFVLKSEVEDLQALGLGKGASYENTLVISEEGLIHNEYRFPDEPVRHKILDLIGDLYLLGAPLHAHIIAVKTGHEQNIKLVREIAEVVKEEKKEQDKLLQGDPIMDIREIMRMLPHRYPFLLVDRIIEFEPGKRVVGIKNVTFNEEFFQGHFPGQPVMPGVLQIEAMAQLSGVLFLRKNENVDKLAYLLSINDAKFRRTVVPGDQLVMEAVAIRLKSKTGEVQTKATVDGKVVSECRIRFMVVDSK
ncbi:MAG: bifunctional UDP-3-O-[3-hydroxymyristoyl] N-acetylglucosamine deacetylase/3-hydroxyacyl-ACP dehydratase [Planctomycetota bacterium]|nr:MAG: bifunctional UDP-3-O-[3-hydroxymyristoyl] N-acetylglucosamine deacetylase/3-hydroxyacyl-ACP dehydratase [Planctomycetota bacterium]